jgi:Flp pilus assembly protein TadD
MRTPVTPKTIRRLLAADGYLHLELPQKAVNELEKIENAGVLEGPRRLLLGLALKRNGEAELAIQHLETAARIMPAPVRSFAWSELAACYRSMQSDDLADLAESLGGEKAYELRIALPFEEISIESTVETAEVV